MPHFALRCYNRQRSLLGNRSCELRVEATNTIAADGKVHSAKRVASDEVDDPRIKIGRSSSIKSRTSAGRPCRTAFPVGVGTYPPPLRRRNRYFDLEAVAESCATRF
jgi:hypothetical protein